MYLEPVPMTEFILTLFYQHISRTYMNTYQYDLYCTQQKQGRRKLHNRSQSNGGEGRKAE